MQFIIYGSGDEGTKELVTAMKNLGIAHTVRDVRQYEGDTPQRDNIKFLLNRGLTKVPQVFDANLRYIGGYEEALHELSFYEAQMSA